VYGEPVSSDYGDRLAFLRRHHIALWDMLATCERTGSADATITNAAPNDLAGLLASHLGIRRILLNGQAAAGYYRRLIAHKVAGVYECVVLPSSSPLNTQALASKVAAWSEALRLA
jgi:hypoxanthine-DNA glycosylase